MLRIVVLLIGVTALLISCSSEEQTETQTDSSVSETAAPDINPADYDLGGETVNLAGITFTPPTDWSDLGPSGMRKASYYFGPVEGETDSATVTVFYFGPAGGGTIEANLDRWIGQMADSDGNVQEPHRYKLTANGMPVHVVSVDGAYAGSMGPMGGSPGGKEDYHMIGAVVEGPEGNVFFKLTGPKQTAEEMGNAFIAMLKSVEKAG